MKTITVVDVKAAWKEYQTTHKHGMALGKMLYNYRSQPKVKVEKRVPFFQVLEDLQIPTSTAYFWIDRYKEDAGIKSKSKGKKKKQTIRQQVLASLKGMDNTKLESVLNYIKSLAGGLTANPVTTAVETAPYTGFPKPAEKAAHA